MDAAALLSGHERMRAAIDKLPTLSEDELPLDDACPICLLPFKLILHPDAASHHPTPEPDLGIDPGVVVIGSSSVSEPGVTRVDGCSHLFCRRDLIEWITSWHGTCPSCRHPFADLKPPSESDNESSDGGEYVPDEDEDLEIWDDHDYSSEIDTDYEIDLSLELEDEMDALDGDTRFDEDDGDDGGDLDESMED